MSIARSGLFVLALASAPLAPTAARDIDPAERGYGVNPILLEEGALGAAEPAALITPITVRVYQNAGLRPALEQRALTEAGTVLRAALVDVRWRRCNGQSLSAPCDASPAPPALLLRITREATPGWGRPDTLGDARVIRGAGGGVLATVYVNRVASLARAARTDVGVLLGRVAAHELGHLMMHSSTHARRGLMRRNWTPEEVRTNRAADWTFTAGDVAAMRRPSP